MARQSKRLRARKPQPRDDSLLLRSAESLGRMIGTLQRQLDIASRQLRGANYRGEERETKDRRDAEVPARTASRKRTTRKKGKKAVRSASKTTKRAHSKLSRPR